MIERTSRPAAGGRPARQPTMTNLARNRTANEANPGGLGVPYEVEAVLAALAKREQPPASRLVLPILLVGSLATFAAVEFFRVNASYVYILIGVLLFHEFGHYIAMRAFGYRNVRMFFIPFFGAAVSGLNVRGTGGQKALVALAGPVPGILVAAGLFFFARHFGPTPLLFRRTAAVLLLLNAFNLLPLMPLDGGRFLDETLFCRHTLLRVGFITLTGGVMLALAWRLQSVALAALGVFMLAGVPGAMRVGRATRKVQSDGLELLEPAGGANGERAVRNDALPALIKVLKSTRRQTHEKALIADAVAMIDQARARPPALAASLQLLTLYGAAVFIALYLLLPVLEHRIPHLRSP